jgi:peptide methionine sulfoxide reductase msrA/msrB
MTVKYNKLSPREKKIIEEKGTEAPFSGEYDKNFKAGIYICRRCDAVLYGSESKFDSGCGWPSFDEEIPGMVKRIPDVDGRRTEITCGNCGAHLGHVFSGEKMTQKDTRHCVNSLSMRFFPADFGTDEPVAVLGGGCFWCLDAIFRQIGGIKEVISGYAGGQMENPTYEEVSSGDSGHAETVRLAYDPGVIKYLDILRIFFMAHDPTSLNRQGGDIGEQYRSIIFYKTARQKGEAEGVIEKIKREKIYERPIVTEIRPLMDFYPAEEYHQNYFHKNPQNAYCQAVINPKLEKLRSVL